MKGLFRIEIDPRRTFGLDVLRAFAILCVVLGHGMLLLPEKYLVINRWLVFDGVSIFFVLSGFLIGGILIRLIAENGLSSNTLLHFWIRRWFRTLPNYFLVLITLCVLHELFGEGFTLRGVAAYFVFSQNIATPHPSFFPEAWSLSIEEWFYLITPVFIALLLSIKVGRRASVLSAALVIIAAATAFRYYRYATVPIDSVFEWDELFRKQVVTRLDGLMFGVVGAYVQHFHHHRWVSHKGRFFLAGILLLLISQYVLPADNIYTAVFSFSVVSIATLFVLPYLSELKTGTGPLFRLITLVSLISYSMYLLHLSLIRNWIINRIPWRTLIDNNYVIIGVRYALYWVLVFAMSALLYKYFEVPVTRLRDARWIRARLASGSRDVEDARPIAGVH